MRAMKNIIEKTHGYLSKYELKTSVEFSRISFCRFLSAFTLQGYNVYIPKVHAKWK